MKITFNVEITEKELAAALLPNGGKITNIIVSAPATRARRAPSATTQKEAVKKTATPKTRKKTIQKSKTTT